jgi:predicted RNA-binding protein
MVIDSKRYWFTITDDINWEIIKKHKIYAINSENKFTLLNKGDFMVMYLVPKQISGIFKITNLESNEKQRFVNKNYKYYFDIKPIIILQSPILINDKWSNHKIIEKISIFKNAKRWGAVMMGKSILEITKKDFEIFESILTQAKDVKNE